MARIPVAERREALIAAAVRVMERDGVAETTTRKIAAEADMPLASLHYAFTSRGELIAAATRSLAIEIVDLMDLRSAADGGLDLALGRSLGSYAEFLREHTGRVLALHETQAAGLRIPELLPIARNRVERGTQIVRFFLEGAAALAGVEYREPVGELAAMLLECVDGFSINWIITRDDAELASSIRLAVAWITNLTRPLSPEAADRARAAFAAADLDRLPTELIEGARTMTDYTATQIRDDAMARSTAAAQEAAVR